MDSVKLRRVSKSYMVRGKKNRKGNSSLKLGSYKSSREAFSHRTDFHSTKRLLNLRSAKSYIQKCKCSTAIFILHVSYAQLNFSPIMQAHR